MRTSMPFFGSDLRDLAAICMEVRRLRALIKLLIYSVSAVLSAILSPALRVCLLEILRTVDLLRGLTA